MQARSYVNLGLTKEHMQEFDKAITYYEKCNKICKSNDLFELHHKSLMGLATVYGLKDDTSMALNQYNVAIEIAKRLHNKIEKMCETLLAKSQLLVKIGDFQSAKQVLTKAYKLNTTNTSDKQVIENNLKLGEFCFSFKVSCPLLTLY